MKKLARFLYVSINWTSIRSEAALEVLTIDSDSNSVDAPRNERVECHINPSLARELENGARELNKNDAKSHVVESTQMALRFSFLTNTPGIA